MALSDELQRKLAPWADKAEGRRSLTSSQSIEEAFRTQSEKALPNFAVNKDSKTLAAVGNDIDLERRRNENVISREETNKAVREKESGEAEAAEKAKEEMQRLTKEVYALRDEDKVSKGRIKALETQTANASKRLPIIIAFVAVLAGGAARLALPAAPVQVDQDLVQDDSEGVSCDELQKEWTDLQEFIAHRGPIREDPGKCWDGPPFTPEICCSPWYGKDGHAGCWTAEMNFQRCCSKYWGDASLAPR
eukprot:GEMP01050380.1.p1 GENE.GEMP01050380.1~~GEMP01050380.1.p1  ORF type:complete len:249 (+),score=73.41 GEMP01050380.1:150-896(+)